MSEQRWQSIRTLGSPPLTNTVKLQLHIEKLSLKSTRELEQLFYKQGCKERYTPSLVGRVKLSGQYLHP